MSIKKQELLSKLESNYLKSNLSNFFIGVMNKNTNPIIDRA